MIVRWQWLHLSSFQPAYLFQLTYSSLVTSYSSASFVLLLILYSVFFISVILFFKDFLNVGHFLKVFVEFFIASVDCVLVFWSWGMLDLSSLTRDWPHTSCNGRWSLNHWISREVPFSVILLFLSHCLFFGSYSSLLNIFCIFSFCAFILFLRFRFIFTVIILNSLLGRLQFFFG